MITKELLRSNWFETWFVDQLWNVILCSNGFGSWTNKVHETLHNLSSYHNTRLVDYIWISSIVSRYDRASVGFLRLQLQHWILITWESGGFLPIFRHKFIYLAYFTNKNAIILPVICLSVRLRITQTTHCSRIFWFDYSSFLKF